MFLNAGKVINTVDRGDGIYTQYYEDGSYETIGLPRATGLQMLDQELIDKDVNYYGFLESTEYNNWIKSIEGQMLTADMYDSPYFGMQSSGAYRELDRIYEAYRARFVDLDDITVSDETYRRELAQREASKGCPPKYPDYSDTFNSCIGYTDRGIIVGPKPTSPGINPMLILAAAAVFFFAG